MGVTHTRTTIRRLSVKEEEDGINLVKEDDSLSFLLSESNYAGAFELIKSNPLTKINFNQAILILNHLGK